MPLCIRSSFSFSQVKRKYQPCIQCRIRTGTPNCLSHSPPAPPLSYQALSLSPFRLDALRPPIFHASFSLSNPSYHSFSSTKIHPRTPPIFWRDTLIHHISLKPISPISLSAALLFTHCSHPVFFLPLILFLLNVFKALTCGFDYWS